MHALACSVAELQPINMSSVDSYEKFKTLMDYINALIEQMNRNTEIFDIPEIKVTKEEWKKISKKFEEYAPLINNYNEVLSTGRVYCKYPTSEHLNAFYKATGKFAFEFLLIYDAVFYPIAYKSVWVIYRASGLSAIARTCPACVKIILSTAHWEIHNMLVEEASKTALEVIEAVNATYIEEKTKNTLEWFERFVKNISKR